MLAFACLIVEHGATFSFLYVYLMIHGHEIAKGFGVFQGYLFGSSMGAGSGLLHFRLIANRTKRIFRKVRKGIVKAFQPCFNGIIRVLRLPFHELTIFFVGR